MRPLFRRNLVAATLLSLVLPVAASAGRPEPQLPPAVLEAKEQAKLAAAAKEPAPVKPIVYDCSKSGLQAVIDAAKDRDVIELVGMCTESVLVDGKRLTLRGSPDPAHALEAPHGIQNPGPFPAVTFAHSPAARLEGLKITGSGVGVLLTASQATMQSCDVSNNTSSGVVAVDATNLMANGLTVQNNGRHGFQAARASTAFCDQCDLSGNATWQGISTFHSLVSIRDSAVTGARGLLASVNSFIDLDCLSIVSSHACSLAATDLASLADSEAVMTYYGSGDFSGSFQAFSGGTTHLWGSRQLSLGTNANNGNPRPNYLDVRSTLDTQPFEDEEGALQDSSFLGVILSGFSTGIFFGETTIGGNVGCDSAGDAWAESSVNLVNGATFVNCEHWNSVP